MAMRLHNLVRCGALLGALGIVGACNGQAPTAPIGPGPSASVAPGASASSSPLAPGTFREDFEGTGLDAERWAAFTRTGIVRVGDGVLELTNSRNQVNYPYVLAKPPVIPAQGPAYFEVAFKLLSAGSVSLSLDYLPAENPEDRPLTQPFLRTSLSDGVFKVTVEHETGSFEKELAGALDGSKRHVLRMEHDGSGAYRLIWDGQEISKFRSRHRPTRFWIGSYPVAETRARAWPHLQVDYVEAGVLTAPASVPVAPEATASPGPSPSPGASASAAPS